MKTSGSLRALLLTGVSLSCLLPAPAAAQRVALTDSGSLISLGAEVYSRHCQRCHNPRSPSERTDRQWALIIQHMQLRANLSQARARAVRAFLVASNNAASTSAAALAVAEVPAETAVTDAMIQAGSTVFRGRGGCAGCHGANLQGGPIAPNLSDARWNRGDGSLAAILRIIRNGVRGTAMGAYPGGISDEDAIRVAAYVWAVSHGRAKANFRADTTADRAVSRTTEMTQPAARGIVREAARMEAMQTAEEQTDRVASPPFVSRTGSCPAVSEALITRGRQVFVKAGNCTACHGANGGGSPLAPDLTDATWLNVDGSYGAIQRVVAAGVPKPRKYPAPMPPMGGAKLSAAQVCAVAAYVYSLSPRGGQ